MIDSQIASRKTKTLEERDGGNTTNLTKLIMVGERSSSVVVLPSND
jgi:hypothetical protein